MVEACGELLSQAEAMHHIISEGDLGGGLDSILSHPSLRGSLADGSKGAITNRHVGQSCTTPSLKTRNAPKGMVGKVGFTRTMYVEHKVHTNP